MRVRNVSFLENVAYVLNRWLVSVLNLWNWGDFFHVDGYDLGLPPNFASNIIRI